jgi:hypothetical protein
MSLEDKKRPWLWTLVRAIRLILASWSQAMLWLMVFIDLNANVPWVTNLISKAWRESDQFQRNYFTKRPMLMATTTTKLRWATEAVTFRCKCLELYRGQTTQTVTRLPVRPRIILSLTDLLGSRLVPTYGLTPYDGIKNANEADGNSRRGRENRPIPRKHWYPNYRCYW